METTVRGLVHSFRVENGFGLLELEDGREVPFDVTACVEEPALGQAVRAVLGSGRTGEPRAILVEPEDQPCSTRPATTLREAIRKLQVEGLVLELDDWETGKLAREAGVGGDSPADLVPLLIGYYADPFVGARRRAADLFVQAAGSADASAMLRDLSEVVGDEPLHLAGHELRVRSVDEIVDAFNEELRGRGDPRRVVPLEAAGSIKAYFCMALARATRLAAMGVLRVRWERPHLTPSEPPPRNA